MKISLAMDPIFTELMQKLMVAPLPLKTAYTIRKIAKTVDEQRAEYEALRVKAVEKYGNKKEDGTLATDDRNFATFSDENGKAFATELDELMSVEFSVPKLKLEDLGENLVLTAQEVGRLEALLES